MKRVLYATLITIASGALLALGSVPVAFAQSAPPAAASGGASSQARAAIEVRKAAYTLIGSNFKPIGNILKGAAPYDAAEAQKDIARIAFLSELLIEAFPDVSNVGEPDTKAKAEIWSNRADFDKKLNQFRADAVALVKINATDQGATEAFKAAATALGQDCKACHDAYKVK